MAKRWLEQTVDPACKSAQTAGQQAVCRLFFEHHRALIAFLKTRLNNPEESEDIAQEVYHRLARKGDLTGVGKLEVQNTVLSGRRLNFCCQ